MAADISSVVAAAIGSRNWWDWWGDAAAIAVTAGVILESVTDVKFLAKITGLSTREALRERIAKFGLGLLIVALVAEVIVGRHVSAATDTIESNLTVGMNRAAEANGRLAIKIKAQEHGLNTAKTDLATAQGKINGLGTTEKTLRDMLNTDDRAIRKQAEYLVGRRLTRRQYEAIRSLRRKIPQLFELTEPHCPECLNFSAQIADVFTRAAGTKVSLAFLDEFEGAGSVCLYEVSPYTEVLRDTFKKGKLAFSVCPKLPERVKTDGTVPIISIGEGPGFGVSNSTVWPWQPGGAWHIKPDAKK